MEEAEKSNSALKTQLKGLYSDLGAMLAQKQKEMTGQSKFVKQPNENNLKPPEE